MYHALSKLEAKFHAFDGDPGEIFRVVDPWVVPAFKL